MYRIVHNPQTNAYRAEKNGLFGWTFVQEKDSGDYLQFDNLETAREWVTATRKRRDNPLRRWRVISECDS